MSDRPVTENELEAGIPNLVAQVDPGLWAELSFFEASLLLGFLTWRNRKSDLNVLEVGLGGRLDATNIVRPEASIITSIGIDHIEYLGGSISQIALEKAGIIHPGCPVFIGFSAMDRDDKDALKVIAAAAEVRSADLYLAGRDFGVEGGQFYFNPSPGIHMTATLPEFFEGVAPYLVQNFAVAAATACWFLWSHGRRSGVPWGSPGEIESLFSGFSQPEGPWAPALCGRFHQVTSLVPGSKEPREILFDVCHNPHGATKFVEALVQKFGPDTKVPGIVSILRDKDIAGILDVLSRKLHPIVLFKITNDRGLNREAIPSGYRDLLPLADDFTGAVRMMRDTLAATNSTDQFPWVVCGSVMAVGEVLGRIKVANSGTHSRTPHEVAMDHALRNCLAMRGSAAVGTGGDAGANQV